MDMIMSLVIFLFGVLGIVYVVRSAICGYPKEKGEIKCVWSPGSGVQDSTYFNILRREKVSHIAWHAFCFCVIMAGTWSVSENFLERFVFVF